MLCQSMFIIAMRILIFQSLLFENEAYKANCNLGKVKIDPMLVAVVLWCQWITRKRMCYDAGW